MDGKIVLQSTFQKSFVQVQSLLDQNRLLIDEINQNQESKTAQKLSRNVGLIRELNDNIRRVVELYAHLSTCCSPTTKPAAAAADSTNSSLINRSLLKRHRPF